MKKITTILTTATLFAVAFSLIDQLVWDNNFYWINAFIGFFIGTTLVLLSQTPIRKTSHITKF